MPELRLTFRQARRLWDFSPDLCELALACLTSRGFLVFTGDGRYAWLNTVQAVGLGKSEGGKATYEVYRLL